MSNQKININNRDLSFKPGMTILEVAEENMIRIPTLCHLKGTIPTGACRICVVEVASANNLLPACSTPAANGMVVETDSNKVFEARRTILELLISSGNHNCAVSETSNSEWIDFQVDAMKYEDSEELCPSWGDCKLQDLCYQYRVRVDNFNKDWVDHPPELDNPMIVRDFSRCITCGRCVQACNEVQVNRAIDFGYRGTATKIVTAGDRTLMDSDCVFCGECVQVCPVGALVDKKSRFKWRPFNTEKIRTTCPYCGVGCQQMLHVKDGEIVKVTGVEEAEPNKGRLCVKGRFGYDFIYSDERLKTPLIKENGEFREASWDEALNLVTDKFKSIIDESGPAAVAGVSCARSINEDSYQMQKLFRAVFKTNNIDHCART